MTKLSIDGVIKDLERKEYIEAMTTTKYGWKAQGRFAHISCPSDLQFVAEDEEPFGMFCGCQCQECWEYVLNNKWKSMEE